MITEAAVLSSFRKIRLQNGPLTTFLFAHLPSVVDVGSKISFVSGSWCTGHWIRDTQHANIMTMSPMNICHEQFNNLPTYYPQSKYRHDIHWSSGNEIEITFHKYWIEMGLM